MYEVKGFARPDMFNPGRPVSFEEFDACYKMYARGSYNSAKIVAHMDALTQKYRWEFSISTIRDFLEFKDEFFRKHAGAPGYDKKLYADFLKAYEIHAKRG